MKLIIGFYFILFSMIFFNETKDIEPRSEELPMGEFSNWLFVQSDKAVQIRFREDSRSNGVGSFTVQVRINYDDQIYCDSPICQGYYLTFAYPTLDNQTHLKSFYKIYNSYKDIYTLESSMELKMEFSDGSKRYLRQEGFYYTLSGSSEYNFANMLFDNCVDDILTNSDFSRCNTGRRRGDFQIESAIVIR